MLTQMFTIKDQYFLTPEKSQNPEREKVNIMRGKMQMLNLAVDTLRNSDFGMLRKNL